MQEVSFILYVGFYVGFKREGKGGNCVDIGTIVFIVTIFRKEFKVILK